MQPSLRIQVSGKVQDVWYRKYTSEKAIELSLVGTVQNLGNGDVLINVHGPQEKVSELEKWCWQGSPQSKVTEVKSESVSFQEFPDFRIIE